MNSRRLYDCGLDVLLILRHFRVASEDVSLQRIETEAHLISKHVYGFKDERLPGQ